MDLSHLDKKYFIDPHIYNCPFCKRNNVTYDLDNTVIFDWNNEKKCAVHFVKCNSCQKTSLHFSFNEMRVRGQYGLINDFKNNIDIDKGLFFSQPSSFFTLDNRIDSKIRDLIWEAEQSRRANLLVGASACLRKAIYELLKIEKAIIKNKSTGYANYQESVKKLAKSFGNVDPTLFDALGNIQEVISDPLHEESWVAWDSPKLRFLIELFKAILEEMYVIPAQRQTRLTELQKLKSDYENGKKIVKA